jgi:hypothetical protein
MKYEKSSSTAELLVLAFGRACFIGSIAGRLEALLLVLSSLQSSDITCAASIAAGVALVLLVELCAVSLHARSPYAGLASVTLAMLLTASAWLLMHALQPFNTAVMLLLPSTAGAAAAGIAAQRRLISTAAVGVPVVVAGALCGSMLGLLLLSAAEATAINNFGLAALSGALPGSVIYMAALRHIVRRN